MKKWLRVRVQLQSTISESISSRSVSSLENTKLSSFSRISFVTNQSGTNFNAGRQASTALLHIS